MVTSLWDSWGQISLSSAAVPGCSGAPAGNKHHAVSHSRQGAEYLLLSHNKNLQIVVKMQKKIVVKIWTSYFFKKNRYMIRLCCPSCCTHSISCLPAITGLFLPDWWVKVCSTAFCYLLLHSCCLFLWVPRWIQKFCFTLWQSCHITSHRAQLACFAMAIADS